MRQEALALPSPSGFARITETLQHIYREVMTPLTFQDYRLGSRNETSELHNFVSANGQGIN
jgi:hypothetical protein